MCGGAGVLLLFRWQKIHFKIYVKRSFFQNKQVEVWTILWRQKSCPIFGPKSARAFTEIHRVFSMSFGDWLLDSPTHPFWKVSKEPFFFKRLDFQKIYKQVYVSMGIVLKKNIYIYNYIFDIYTYIYVLSAGRIAGERGSCHDMFMIYSFEPYIGEVEYLESYVKLHGK